MWGYGMSNSLDFRYESTRRVLCHGARAVLYFTGELPVGETPLVRHVQALEQALFTHAKEQIFPKVAQNWETLAKAGKGYDFSPRYVTFRVTCAPCGRDIRVHLHLFGKGGGEADFLQETDTYWSADGQCARKRASK